MVDLRRPRSAKGMAAGRCANIWKRSMLETLLIPAKFGSSRSPP